MTEDKRLEEIIQTTKVGCDMVRELTRFLAENQKNLITIEIDDRSNKIASIILIDGYEVDASPDQISLWNGSSFAFGFDNCKIEKIEGHFSGYRLVYPNGLTITVRI